MYMILCVMVWTSGFRDVEVYEFLQQRWNGFVRGTELNHNGVAVQGDLKINGSNTCH